MNRFIILAFLVIETVFCSAQKKITLCGKVMDENHIALIDAGIINLQGKETTSTNKNGFFYLSSEVKDFSFQIEYTGYQSFLVKISADSIKSILSDTMFLGFVMEIKTIELDSVTVTSEKTKLVYNNPRVIVFDYDFYKDFVLLLVFENQKYKLKLIDNEGKDLGSLVLSRKSENLFTDCYNNIHVLGTDSTHQIKFDNTKMSLLEGHSLKKFNEYVSPLALATSTNLFYKTYGPHNQSITYYNYDKAKSVKTKFKEVRNAEAESFASYNHRGFRGVVSYPVYYQGAVTAGMTYRYVNQIPKGYSNQDTRSGIWKYRTRIDGDMEAFYQTVLTIPIYAPFLAIGDSLFLFDHIDDEALVYTPNGVLQRKFPLSYHHQKGWRNELIMDNSGNKIYAKFIKGDKCFLQQIDLTTGRPIATYSLDQVFCKDIKIKDGYAYYLYKDRYQESAIDNLYKQKLK